MKLQTQQLTETEYSEQQAYISEFRNLAPLKFLVRTFGCQQNESDSEVIAGLCLEMGFTEVSRYEDADIVLINTCSIRENADRRLFGHLGLLKRLAEERAIRVFVCGCMMTQEQHVEKIRKSFGNVRATFAPHEIYRLPEILWRGIFGQKRILDTGNGVEPIIVEGLPVLRQRRFQGKVSIMYGCNNFCSYCIVPYTRGRERSRSAEHILKELRELAASGIPEVLLLGQNVNAWGKDLFPDYPRSSALIASAEDLQNLENVANGTQEARSFAELLLAAAQIPGLRRIRYLSSHPRDFSGQLFEVLRRCPNVESRLHLPLQAGSDRILKLMNRHYDSERYRAIVAAARAARPDLSLTTDLIVGFPQESEEDFAKTMEMVEEMRYEAAFTFIYSAREGTKAATMEQVPSAVQHERFERLLELQNRISLETHQNLIGSEAEVLLEGISNGDDNVLTGRDSAFHLVNIPVGERERSLLPFEAFSTEGKLSAAYFEGRFAQVRFTVAKTFSCEAELIEMEK